MASKKSNKRIATRRAKRLRYPLENYDALATRDSMRAARRFYGQGQGVDR